MIEQVLIKKTVKAGDTVWLEGSIETSPLPAVLLEEVRLNTASVEVLRSTKDQSSSKLIFVAKMVEEANEITTTTSQSKLESGEVLKSVPPPKQLPKHKPKPKLVRRKR